MVRNGVKSAWILAGLFWDFLPARSIFFFGVLPLIVFVGRSAALGVIDLCCWWWWWWFD